MPATWGKRLVDLNVTHLTDEDLAWADFVFISAMVVQRASARTVIQRCKLAGVKVVADGPLFTMEHEQFPEVDHFVLNNLIVTHVWSILAGRNSERWQERGPLKENHHWQYEFKEKIEENADDEVERGDYGKFEEDESASEPEEYVFAYPIFLLCTIGRTRVEWFVKKVV